MYSIPENLVESLSEYKVTMVRRPSVTDIVQTLPWKFPHLLYKDYSLHSGTKLKGPEVSFPIAIAFGDRDFLCSRGADEFIK